MKKQALLAIVFAVFALLVSCSAVFDAGIGGKVYYIQNGSEVGIYDAKILVYDNDSFTDVIGSTRTDANGNFSVSKIVWKTTDPKYGKTADNHTVYIKVVHEDFKMKSDYITARIISDSTNSGMADVEMEKVRYTVPTFSGRIVAVDDADKTKAITDKDGLAVHIVYKDKENKYTEFPNNEAVVYTTAVQAGTDYSPYYIHGTFSGLGGGDMKYSVKDYPEVYVLVVLDTEDKVAGPYPIDGVSSYQIYEDEFETVTL